MFAHLTQYLLEASRLCLRPPVGRFRHPWLSPMPLSPAARGLLASDSVADANFAIGDYSLGLFHHDATEASIELLHHPEFHAAALGSLLSLLDCAAPNGCVYRVELPSEPDVLEPSKPVLAQHALRITKHIPNGLAVLDQHQVAPRLIRFLHYLEQHYRGPHGLFLTHSALQSGFDSDHLTLHLPDASVAGPDTNTFMVLEYRALGALLELLGRSGQIWREKADALADAVNQHLWHEDEHGGLYLGLLHNSKPVTIRDPDGVPRPVESWIGALPLYAGIPSPAQAERLFARYLDPQHYAGPFGLRTAPASDPFFTQAPRLMIYELATQRRGPVSNWSGPYWVLSNYYFAEGLRRYGKNTEAHHLATVTAQLLADDLARTGRLHECYNDQGLGLWPQRGTFISWNVLALTLLRNQNADWIG